MLVIVPKTATLLGVKLVEKIYGILDHWKPTTVASIFYPCLNRVILFCCEDL